MLPYRDSRFTTLALIVFFVLVAGYGIFEARGLLFGPTINVSGQTATVQDPYVVIQGRADRISSLSMNGNPVQVTETGVFAQPYLLAAGSNKIILDATDQYGRERSRVIEIMYTPRLSATSSAIIAPQETLVSSTSSSTAGVAPMQ